MDTMTQIEINGYLHLQIKPTGQGFVGIVSELPIVIESSTQEQLQIDLSKAIITCFNHNPELLKQFVSVKLVAQ